MNSLENKLGFRLPQDYLAFLASDKPQALSPMRIKNSTSEEEWWDVRNFLCATDQDDALSSIIAARDLLEYEYGDIWQAFASKEKLPIAWSDGGGLYTLARNSSGGWDVAFLYLDVDPVDEGGDLELVHFASSFTEFLEGLEQWK